MEFDWDVSNLGHLARHHISRAEFEQAMKNDPILVDFRDERGEERWCAVSATGSLRVLFLVFTYRGESVRAITGWNAGRRLTELHFRTKTM